MPISAAPVTVRRTASAPRLCPAIRGRPRHFAQRPLPSMMIATWTGGFAPGVAGRASMGSDLQDLLLLLGQRLVDLLDVLVRQPLHLLIVATMLVLGDLAVLLHLLQRFHAVPPHVANGDPALLRVFVRELRELLAPLAAELGDRDAHELAVRLGIDPEIGLADRLLDRGDQAAVPDLDRDHARLRHADGAHLVERHLAAIGLDHHRVQQMDGGAAGAQARELPAQRLQRAVHTPLQLVHQLVCHGVSCPCQSETIIVYLPLPVSTSARPPGLLMENTRIGMRFSRARETAAASITFRSRESTSRWVSFWNRSAFGSFIGSAL